MVRICVLQLAHLFKRALWRAAPSTSTPWQTNGTAILSRGLSLNRGSVRDRLSLQVRAAFDLAPVQLRLLGAFKDMRGHAAPLQRLAELDAQETGRGVARDPRVEAVDQPADHGGILVEQFGYDREIVVVDDCVDALVQSAELALDGSRDRVDIGLAAQCVAL